MGETCSYIEIVQLMLPTAPDAVVKIIALPNEPQAFVSVVPEHLYIAIVVFEESKAPILDVDVLMPRMLCLLELWLGQWDRRSVQIMWEGCACQREEGWCQICMGSHNFADLPLRNSRATYNQWDVDVFLESALFSWLQSMLTYVITIVTGIEDVGFI